MCVWAAKKVGRPVKWTADRTEAFLADAHGRDHVTDAELALDAERQDPGAAGQDQGQPRRLPLDLRLLGADLSLRAAAVGPVRHPGDLLRGRRRLHQHRAGRRLSRRRPAGGDLRGRAPGRGGGARARPGPGRVPPQELHQDLPAPDAGHHDLRRRRLRRLRSTRRWSMADYKGFGARKARERPQGQAARHRLLRLHRGLRHRAVARRSARSAPASACGNRPRCGSIPPARWRC